MNDRTEIGQAILDLGSTCESEDFLAGQIDALATSIGGLFFMSGRPLAEAETFAAQAAATILDHVRANWGAITTAPAFDEAAQALGRVN